MNKSILLLFVTVGLVFGVYKVEVINNTTDLQVTWNWNTADWVPSNAEIDVLGYESIKFGSRTAPTGTTWGYGVYRGWRPTNVGNIGYEGGPTYQAVIFYNNGVPSFLIRYGNTIKLSFALCTNEASTDDTDNPPTFDASTSSFVSPNKLALYVTVPHYQGRTLPVFVLNEGFTDPDCSPESVKVISESVCTQATFKVVYNWQNAYSNCGGFVSSSSGSITSELGRLGVSFSDPVEDTRGNTYIKQAFHKFAFVVRFNNEATSSTCHARVVSTVNADAVITSLVAAADGSYLGFSISVQYPYVITIVNSTGTSGPHSTTLVQNSASAATSEGEITKQDFTLSWDTVPCELDGVYDIQGAVQVACLPGPSCPDLSSATFDIEFTVDTDDLCAQITEDVDAVLAVSIFFDAGLTHPAINFYQTGSSQLAYFLAWATSNKVSVDSITIKSIVATVESFDTTLFISYANTIEGNATSLVVTGSTFSLDIESPLFAPAVDQITDFTITVVVDVYYSNTVKRALLSQSFTTSAKTSFQMTPESASASLVVFFAAFILMLF